MTYPSGKGGRRYTRPLIKKDIEIAYAHANSAAEAARYLDVSYKTFKKYAELYGIFKTNQSGEGVTRPKMRGKQGLLDILDGKYPGYSKTFLMERSLRAGIFKKECYSCGFKEVRIDGKMPLLFHHIDGDSRNLRRDNLEPWCYNCMFLTSGKVDMSLLELDPVVFQNDIIDTQDDITQEDLERLQEQLLQEVERERSEDE